MFYTVKANDSGDSLPSDCTLSSIASTCYFFQYELLVYDLKHKVRSAAGEPCIEDSQWICNNRLPQSVVDVINDVIND